MTWPETIAITNKVQTCDRRRSGRYRRQVPSLSIEPRPGGDFRSDYSAVMRKWADAIDRCPSYIKDAVDYAFGQLEAGREAG